MRRKFLGLSALVWFVAAVLTIGVKAASAQGNSGNVEVINEVKHDKHALGPDDQLPYAGGTSASKHERALLLTHAPGLLRKMRDPALQGSTGPTVVATPGASFQGVSANGWAPPDTNGAAGPTQYVQWVNTEFAAFNKSDGTIVYGPAEGNTIWSGFGGSCESRNDGDPIAQYDKQAGVWVMMQPVFKAPYAICIAVSTSSTWTSSGMTWNRYQFLVPNSSKNFPDYPKLSVWSDGYYISYNSFTNGSRWAGPQACVMDRSAMLAGNSATMQCAASPGTTIETMLPSDLDGAVPGVSGSTLAPPQGSPAYYVGIYSGSSSKLALFKFHVNWTTPSQSSFSPATYVNISSFNEACGGGTCIPQPNTSQQLDSLADRLMYRLAYRNFGDHESLVISHSVDPGNGTSGIRWYEIRSPGSSPTVYQQGTFAPDSNYRWMPSIAMDKSGDIAVGYSESSSSMAPSIFYNGRLSGDPAGTLESEAPILNGAYSQTTGLSRWGDYSAMSVDPTDDCTFWYTNEYLPSSGTFNWATQIASFKFSSCGGSATPDFSIAVTPTSQTVNQGGAASYTVSITPTGSYAGTVNLTATGAPSGATVGFSPASVTAASPTSTMTITLPSSTTSGDYTVTVTGTDSADSTLKHSATVTLVVNPPPDFSISASPTQVSVVQGNSGNSTITSSVAGGFSSSISLSVSGQPSGVTVGFNPSSISGAGTSDMTMNVGSSVTAGTYQLTVTGMGGGLTRTTTVNLVVTQAVVGSFTISAPASASVSRNNSVSIPLTVTSNGFSGSVSLSASLPPRTSGSFSPPLVTFSGSGTNNSTLTITALKSGPTGQFTLTITGSSGSLTSSTTMTLNVN
jgi:hypothetical protein